MSGALQPLKLATSAQQNTNMPEYTIDWFSRHISIWTPLLTPLKDNILDVIEIGSFEGRSTVWLLENVLLNPESTITCVDSFNGGDDLKNDFDWSVIKDRFLSNIEPFKEKVTLVCEDSTGYLKKRMKMADIIYVDGSHSAYQSLVDAVQAHLLLNKNGIIIFDDYLWRGGAYSEGVPKQSIDAFWSAFSSQYEILSIGYQLILRKK